MANLDRVILLRSELEARLLRVSLYATLIIAGFGILFGFLARSTAILFDGVFSRDEAGDRPELVHHDGYVDASLGEGVHQRRDLEHLADNHRLFCDFADRCRSSLFVGEEEVTQSYQPDDLLTICGDGEP